MDVYVWRYALLVVLARKEDGCTTPHPLHVGYP